MAAGLGDDAGARRTGIDRKRAENSASTLPAPTPRKSRSTSAGFFGSDRNERVVAAVCTITTIAITKASGTSRSHRSGARSGKVGIGKVAGTVPTTLTPLFSSPAPITASVAATSPISAPGIFALIVSQTNTAASTPKPSSMVTGLDLPSWPAIAPMRSSVDPGGEGRPSTPGSCDTMMCTEMPSRNPTVTGTDNRFAMPPSLNRPLASSMRPTISASAIASA